MTLEEIISVFKEKGDPGAAEGMARFGIETSKVYGVKLPELRRLAKEIGRNHESALRLWE
jgi:3-methyladenine DNA glycosylase AlkD